MSGLPQKNIELLLVSKNHWFLIGLIAGMAFGVFLLL